MKITFIRPNMYDDRSSDAMEPLCFAILKALTPPDIDVSFFDDQSRVLHHHQYVTGFDPVAVARGESAHKAIGAGAHVGMFRKPYDAGRDGVMRHRDCVRQRGHSA